MSFLKQLLKFGAVGGAGIVVNLIVFSLLESTVFNTRSMHLGAIYSTIVATVCAIAVNWVGNRFWAFREHRRADAGREVLEFFAVSLVGLLIPLACVWISHYVLHYESRLADSIANNVVGLILGTVFRFALYRLWVYAPHRSAAARAAASPSPESLPTGPIALP